jgi:prephenate dehydrogenase
LAELGVVAIVGVGLIGGSIGKALLARGLATRVVGVGRNPDRLAEAVRLGAIDSGTTDLAEGVSGAQIAVVCTPVTQIASTVQSLADAGPDELLITDAGSTKRAIVDAVERHPRARSLFVGAHPIAGSERQGVEHSDPQLFDHRACVLTPTPGTPADRLERAIGFWSAIGCRVTTLDPAIHDETLALTSHLPHVVAAALAGTVPAQMLSLAAGAYRDGTRVAGADANLWAAIFHENRAPLLSALREFEHQIATFRAFLEADDCVAIERWWDAAKVHRLCFDPTNAGQ